MRPSAVVSAVLWSPRSAAIAHRARPAAGLSPGWHSGCVFCVQTIAATCSRTAVQSQYIAKFNGYFLFKYNKKEYNKDCKTIPLKKERYTKRRLLTMKRKWFASLLAICMLILLIPASAFAADGDVATVTHRRNQNHY